jgi:hypothetical protein
MRFHQNLIHPDLDQGKAASGSTMAPVSSGMGSGVWGVESIKRNHARICVETKPASHPSDWLIPDDWTHMGDGHGYLRAVVDIATDATTDHGPGRVSRSMLLL